MLMVMAKPPESELSLLIFETLLIDFQTNEY